MGGCPAWRIGSAGAVLFLATHLEVMQMSDYRICHTCGNKMFPAIKDFEYRHKNEIIIVKDINCYICSDCGEVIYTSEEAKRIEEAIISQR